MLGVTSTLLAAARSGSATPYLRLTVTDRDAGVTRLRPLAWRQGEEPAGPAGVACPGDGSLVRARIDPADGTLSLQRVETPSAEAAFDAWSSVGTVEAACGLGLHANGARVLLATYEGGDVTVRESTDNGATFGSPATVATVADVTAVACATDSDGTAAVFHATSDGLVWATTRSGSGAWGTPVEWGHGAALASVNALAASREPDWVLLVSGGDAEGRAGAWCTRLGAGVGAPPGAWSALVPVILASPGTDVTYRASGVVHAAAPRLLLVESYAGTGAFDQPMLATALAGAAFADGLWHDPLPLGMHAPTGVAAARRGDDIYLASSAGVWHASTAVTPFEAGPAVTVLRYLASTAPGGGDERLAFTVALDAAAEPAALEAALRPGAEIAFRAGYATDGGLEAPAGRTLWVTSVRREAGLMHVEAEGAAGALRHWRASRQITWAEGESSILGIADAIARFAGFTIAAEGPSAAAQDQEPAFTVRAGDAGSTALARLFARTPDLLFSRGLQVVATEASPDAPPVAVFAREAAGEVHSILVCGRSDGRPRTGWARVLGDGAAAQAVDVDALATGGGVALAVDETLNRRHGDGRAGRLGTASSDASRGGGVAGGGPAPRAGAGGRGGGHRARDRPGRGRAARPVGTAGLRRTTARAVRHAPGSGGGLMFVVERGTLLAFSSEDHTATVRFAGSLSAVVPGVPVSRGIDAAEMQSGRRLAVAIFDAAAPGEAMVVGVW